jgi:bacteriorhodopsin
LPISSALIPTIPAVVAPWHAELSQSQHTLILYALTVGLLGFVAALIRAAATMREVGARYRTAVLARLGVLNSACLGYVAVIIEFHRGYDFVGQVWVPNVGAINTFALRYAEWTISVPLITVEVLAVCALAGSAARRTRLITMSSGFLMVMCGFIGAILVGGGEDLLQLRLWGAGSAVFWVITNVMLWRAVTASERSLTPEASRLLRNAVLLLIAGWTAYPVVYSIPTFAWGGEWTVATQVGLTIADLLVKLAFAGVIHRVAKLRTAEDVRAGDDVHPEAIWISSVKQSDAGLPRQVYLPDEALVHRRRDKPPLSEAVPMTNYPDPDDQ